MSFIVESVIRLTGNIERGKLVKASKDPRHSSAQTLRAILSYAENTLYGREHYFSEILAAKDDETLFSLYEKHVQGGDFEGLRPYVEKHKEGHGDILIPGKPLMYATTSGTTALPKWLPMSHRYIKSVYGKMSRVWLANFCSHRPGALSGGIMFSVSKAVEGYAPDGTVIGAVSGLTVNKIPSVIRKHFVAPNCVCDIEDYEARYYVLMRLAIAQDITLLATANPSTIVELAHNSDMHYDEYIEDIEKGTISDKYPIDVVIRAKLLSKIKPDPKRAAFLRSLKADGKQPLIKDYWPNLKIMCTWRCGNTAIAAEKVAAMIPEKTFYQELGFFSSECRFGLVLDESNETVLFPHMHYYEFVEESEIESATPHFLRLHQLEVGKKYCPYITTFSGLYRYNMHDLIEVGGKFKNTPTVHMVQKINGIVSITGEKLYEKQFIDAVHKAEKQTKTKVEFFIGFADAEESLYNFYYEFADTKISRAQAESFTEKVDENLKKMNIEYLSKRDSLRLKMPKTFILQPNSYETFKQTSIKEGARDGQFKLVLLLQDKIRQRRIKRLIKREK